MMNTGTGPTGAAAGGGGGGGGDVVTFPTSQSPSSLPPPPPAPKKKVSKRGRPPSAATNNNTMETDGDASSGKKPEPKRKKRDSAKHNQEEFRRRQRIRERFEQLKVAAESRNGEREKVLCAAIDRIRVLKERIYELEGRQPPNAAATNSRTTNGDAGGDGAGGTPAQLIRAAAVAAAAVAAASSGLSLATTNNNHDSNSSSNNHTPASSLESTATVNGVSAVEQFVSPNAMRAFHCPMVYASVDGVIHGANVGFAQTLGHTMDNLRGRTLFSLTAPPQLTDFCATWQRVLQALSQQDHVSLETESVWKRADESLVPVHLTCFTMTTSTGFKDTSYVVFIVVPRDNVNEGASMQQDEAAQLLSSFPAMNAGGGGGDHDTTSAHSANDDGNL